MEDQSMDGRTAKFNARQAVSARDNYFISHMSGLHPMQQKLIQLTMKNPQAAMLGAADALELLTNMLKFAGAKRCLDIGVYTGYSALSWALSIPEDGKVVACDITDEYAQIGIPVWKEAGVYDKIDFRVGDAAVTLQSLLDSGEAGTYDFAFIDADKEGYDTYYELSLKLLRKDGIIAIDNTWYGGLAFNPRGDSEGSAIRALCDKIPNDDRVAAVMVDIGDGDFIVRKK